MKQKKRAACLLSWMLTILWTSFIFSRSLKPAGISSEESGAIVLRLQILGPWVTDHLVRKTAHFAEYAVLGGLLFGSFRFSAMPWLLPPALLGLAAAAVDEWIQTAVPGRSGQISDVLLDWSGVLAALLLLSLCAKIRQSKRSRKLNPREKRGAASDEGE